MAEPGQGDEESGAADRQVPAASQTDIAEVCAFCGERHPAAYKCGQWAQLTGITTHEPGDIAAFAALPRRPTITPGQRLPKAPPNPHYVTALRIGVVCLAVVGAVALVVVIGGRLIGGGSAPSAALPACTPDRVRQNLVRAATIMSETRSSLDRRIDETNGLLLGSSVDCQNPLFLQYTAFIGYQTLCLGLRAADACANRDTARAVVGQALADQ